MEITTKLVYFILIYIYLHEQADKIKHLKFSAILNN